MEALSVESMERNLMQHALQVGKAARVQMRMDVSSQALSGKVVDLSALRRLDVDIEVLEKELAK